MYPRLPDAEWKRVQDACYYHNTSKCTLIADQCFETYKKKHELLPKKLRPYLREPGKRRRKGTGTDTEATSGGEAKKLLDNLKVRWATNYCHYHADKLGSCKKGDDCTFEHLAEAEAKEKAES